MNVILPVTNDFVNTESQLHASWHKALCGSLLNDFTPYRKYFSHITAEKNNKRLDIKRFSMFKKWGKIFRQLE